MNEQTTVVVLKHLNHCTSRSVYSVIMCTFVFLYLRQLSICMHTKGKDLFWKLIWFCIHDACIFSINERIL